VTPDSGGSKDPTPCGAKFKKSDLAPIPACDVSFGMPKWMGNGDTAWRTPGKDWTTWKPTDVEG